ncbi:AsmA-like C-terminal region-containing protein [Flavobacterium sp. DG1-102-2]|uniref:AsmA family protein n=1 Tax=Flavobacterium sp. DG1-102-2 TaxID=3081663 RepID=UPI00294A90F8|nr:AsmA-like C-terminal region-containing protein [Flavobacterium sp. DG1-102-2]MDV6169339.1 AsmA-like C-terminal region-containing protein [Flavobacterium sp. DG1-102-2]
MSPKKIIVKILEWTGVGIAAILLLMFLIPLLFPGTIAQQVKVFANKSLDGELNFTNSKLSFFTHFPSLTVSLDELSLKGSAPFKNDTLLSADQVAFGINLKRLIFDNEIKIDKIYVSDALINVMVNEKGQANYNVYVAPKDQPKDTTGTGPAIRLDRVDLENCHIKYNDKSARILVDAKGFNYVGRGNLSEDVFDLQTDANIDVIDFILDGVPYLEKKQVHADLVTRINTNALSFILTKNELRINRLPLEFNGIFTILKDGYNIDIKAISENNKLKDLFSVLPPQYKTWMEDTKIKGKSDLLFTFKGRYNAAENLNPDLGFRIKIWDGSVNYKDAPLTMSDFEMNLSMKLPSLDPERLDINLSKLDFNLGDKDKFHAFVIAKGLSEMTLKAQAKGTLDLAALDRSLGIDNMDLKGLLKADITADGIFSAEKRLFPKTHGGVNLQNGWLKTKYYPNAITDIKFVANVQNDKGTFDDVRIAVTPASFVFEGNPVYVSAKVSNFDDVDYNAKIKGELNIGRIYKVFSQKGLDVKGYAKADLSLNGRQSYATTGQYSKLDNRGTLLLKDIRATSESFPKPFDLTEGHFRFQNEKMWFEKFLAGYGKSDFAIKGYLLNTINYFLESKGTLHGNFDVKSKRINVDEFMALQEGENKDVKPEVKAVKEANPKMTGVVVLPTNLDVSLVADADKVEYTGLVLNKLKGKVGISKGKLYLDNANFNIIDCLVTIDAGYDDESPMAANFNVHFKAKDFDVKRAYKEIPLFHDLVTAAEKAEGIISLDYELNGDLDGNMSPIYPSLKGGGTISVRDVKVAGLKMFGSMGDKTGVDGMKNPNMKDVNIKTSIDNNLIRIEPFTLKVATFRPTIKGTTSFDGLLDIRVRLGLPPGGLIGIPIVITGTHEAPKIKIFSKSGQEIKEAEYNEKTNQVIKEEKRAPETEKKE